MPLGKGRRKLWLAVGFFVAGLAMIWLGCPLWLPWVLRPLASRVGASFNGYERDGYARFMIQDLSVTNPAFILRAKNAEAVVPSVWLWRLGFSHSTQRNPFLLVTNWQCQLLPSRKPAQPPVAQVGDLAEIFSALRRWVPFAELRDGTVSSGDTTFLLPQSNWRQGALETSLRVSGRFSNETVRVDLRPARPFQVRLSLASQKLEGLFMLATNRFGLDLQTSIQWQSNHVVGQAHFRPADFLPETATLRATDFHLPADMVSLEGYREISGSVTGDWRNGKFSADLAGGAAPSIGSSNLPPVDFKVRTEGDTNGATIQALEIRAPFLRAELSAPISLAFSPPFLRGQATLRLAADLDRQQWIALDGKVEGQADLSPGQGVVPTARLRLQGAAIRYEGIPNSPGLSLDLAALLNWPMLEVSSAEFRFDEGSQLNADAKLDLKQKSVAAGHFQFKGPLAKRWLPTGYSYTNLAVRGSIEGPLQNPKHTGRLVAERVDTPWMESAALDLNWAGTAENVEAFDFRITQPKGSIAATGAVSIAQSKLVLKLVGLDLTTNRSLALHLQQPATISFTPGRGEAGWLLDTTPLRLEGSAGLIAIQTGVRWPAQGALEVTIQHISSGLPGSFLKSTLPKIELKQLQSSVTWSNGPATLSLLISGTGTASDRPISDVATHDVSTVAAPLLTTPLNFELQLSGDARGLVLSNLVINTSTSSVATAHGFLPVAVTPGSSTNLFDLAPNAPLQLKVAMRPQAYVWHELAVLTRVKVDEPNLDLDLSGTWLAPQGKLELRARNIQLPGTNSVPLQVSDLRLALILDREMARITEGQVLVQGQRVDLTAELPLGGGVWTNLIHGKFPSLDKATARLLVPEAQLAAFEPLFPELLAPQGDFSLDLRLLPGPNLEGAVKVRRARTRPLGNTAPFRDINVTLRFHDRLFSLENATANLSGAEVALSGKADLRGTNWLHGELPPFELVLRGTNVPVAREPEYILRTDLDLAVAKTNGAPPLVYGTAHLRDSFYLSDLSALVPDKAASPGSRPPYFSIDNPILADWRVAVTVEGVHWLKLRTSLFNGEASANLHLQGSLKDPLALGVLKIDSGLVRFPFANLQVQQGLVTLASQDPYHPQLLVRANSKQFGYDIHMEVSGPVDSPVIQFTSNPSLSSEQILLMITAGQLPAGNLTLTPQQRAQTVALFLGRDLLSKLGMGDQSKDRLTITSGEEVSEQGKPTYHVEYKLSNRWAVEGEYDRFGDFNADLKWRIYSK